MKRFFTYIAILALAVACNDELYGPEETPLTPDAAGSVEIAVSDVTDNSFKVTVTPSGNVAYYSYLVDAAATAEELNAETLFQVGYKSVAQGTVKYSAEEPSYTFEVKADPNTTYQIYAVAGSEMGFVSAVVNKSVLTTDTVAPGYESFETDANQVVFTFSEAVTRKAENGAIKVPYYAYYSAEFQTTAAAAGEVTVPEDSILVAGNQALISVPDLPTGCYWTISIPEGAFVDAVGQKLPAYASAFVMVEGEKGPAPSPKGFYGEVDYVELPMLGELELEAFTEWDGGFLIPLENEYALAGFSSKKFITVTYEAVADNSVETIVYTLTPGADYNVTSLGLVVNLPAEPMCLGADVTISVPAGTLYDVFGNDCEAWEHAMKYSYGYTLKDIVGTYAFAETSALYGQVYVTELVIEESDDAKKGNVMFTVYDDFECEISPIYATFDVDAGILSIPSGQVFGVYEAEDGSKSPLVFGSGVVEGGSVKFAVGKDPVEFEVPAAHTIVGPNWYYGVYMLDEKYEIANIWDLYYAAKGELAPETETPAPAAVRNNRHNRTLTVNHKF